jgi:trigger factor
VKVEVKELEGLKREVKVELSAETVESEMAKKFEEVRKEAKFDGYRPGKAPLARVKAEYGPAVRAAVQEDLIRNSYPDAVRQQELRVASYPTVTTADYVEGGGFGYTAEVEVYPHIERVGYDGMEVQVTEIEVEDKDVDDFIEGLRRRLSELRPVTRPAGPADVVVADLQKLHDPSLVLSGDKFPDQEIDLGNVVTVKEFKEQLAGSKPGDEIEVEVNYPKDYPDETFAGATVKYKCQVKEIKERILPEFNDAFAKQTGQAETALELRMQIRDEIGANLKQEQDRNKRSQLIRQLNEKNDIPIPDGLVDEYLNNVVEDFKKRYEDTDEAEVRRSYRDVGIKTIRWNLLFNQLAEQERIEVGPADIEQRIKKFADNYKMSVEKAKEALNQSGSIAQIRDSILEEKVLDFLVDKAKVTTQKKQP